MFASFLTTFLWYVLWPDLCPVNDIEFFFRLEDCSSIPEVGVVRGVLKSA